MGAGTVAVEVFVGATAIVVGACVAVGAGGMVVAGNTAGPEVVGDGIAGAGAGGAGVAVGSSSGDS